MTDTLTNTHAEMHSSDEFLRRASEPCVLVGFSYRGTVLSDRSAVRSPFVVGRSSDCSLVLRDQRLSKAHFRIDGAADTGFSIEDLGSTNGTYLNGNALAGPAPLKTGYLIRAGHTIMVFHEHAGLLMEPPPADRFGMSGKFHVAELLSNLAEVALSSRHVLICGPSGSGKELAARALTGLYGESAGRPLHMLAHNAARFSSEEEAASTLFGVASKTFSEVSARAGLIEQADGGVLFLDEVHNLPMRVQRTLLRVMEDAEFTRIGESTSKRVNVRFVFASNAEGEFSGMAPDLHARCREVHVPPLEARLADIPVILKDILFAAARRHSLDPDDIFDHVTCNQVEALCLDGFPRSNVRGIIDLVDRIITRIIAGTPPEKSVASVFSERFGMSLVAKRATLPAPASGPDDGVSHYERHREFIVQTYTSCNGNFSAMERVLKKKGINCSRRWLKTYADKWGLTETGGS